MRHFLICLVFFTASANVTTAQTPEIPARKFLSLLNQFKRDSLDLILTEDFTWKENFAHHTWSRAGFLDTFLLQSRAINGTFRILKTYPFSRDVTVYQVQDQSDYITYLRPKGRLVWNLKILSKGNKISEVISDSTRGNKDFMNDLVKKHTAFTVWLNKKYPGEDEEQLYREQKIRDRLIEFANKKD